MLQDMYHSEATAEVAPSSDASGAQRENPKSADAIAVMPHVLKLEMAFAKLPLPNKKATRRLVDTHFRSYGGNMEGLGHIRKVCFSSRQKSGLLLWIECERDVMQKLVRSTLLQVGLKLP